MKNKMIAALLALFFGGFGVHKFYLRDPGAGIFYIMLMVFSSRLMFPISNILGVIDAIALFTMSQEKFDKKYNQRGNQQQSRRGRQRNGRPGYRDQRRTETRNRRNQQYEPQPTRRREPTRKRNVIKDNPFKKSGLKHLEEYELDLAEDELLKAIELSPDDQEIHYGLAKLFSLTEKKDKAYLHLSQAVQKGMVGKDQIMNDDELAYLRIQDDFDAFKANGFMHPPRKSGQSANDDEPRRQQNAPIREDLLQDDLLLSQLNKLAELRKKGLLSEQEFQEEKVKLLNK